MLHYIVTSGRIVVVAAIVKDILRIGMLSALGRLPVAAKHLKFYRQLQIISFLTIPLEQLGSAQVLLSEGAIAAIGVPFIFLCLKLNYTSIALMAVPAVTGAFIVIQVFFSLCTALHSLSEDMIRQWLNQAEVCKGYKKKYYIRYLKGVKTICIPIWNVGVFDNDIRTNYTEKLKGYCVDFTTAIRESLN